MTWVLICSPYHSHDGQYVCNGEAFSTNNVVCAGDKAAYLPEFPFFDRKIFSNPLGSGLNAHFMKKRLTKMSHDQL
jgi:hypothetical protein